MSFRQKAISGFSWQSVLKISTTLIAALKIIILVRILTPHDFGLFSLVAIALGLSEAMTQTGINYTIIQSKHSINYFLDTAWVISIVRGFIIGILMILLGFILSTFFKYEKNLLFLISLASLIPIIKGFINPAIVSLQKKFLFYEDSFFRITIVIIEAAVSILFAYFIIQSASALIFGMIVAAISEVVLSLLLIKDRPRFVYSQSRAQVIFKQTKWLSLATFFNYLNENFDDFLIGSFLGTHHLGLYHNAYSLSHKPNLEIAKLVHRSNLPIYARIKKDKTRLTLAFRKTMIVLFILTISLSWPLLVAPKFIVNLFFGDQWLAVIPLIIPLTIAGLIQAFSRSVYTFLMGAEKNTHLINYHLGLSLLLMTILIYFLANSSLELIGVGWAIMLARLLALPLIIFSCIRTLKAHD